MKQLPDSVEKYSSSPVFSEESIPNNLCSAHATKAGVWGRIVVKRGALTYTILGTPEEAIHLTPGVYGIIEPETPHFVTPEAEVEFQVADFLAVSTAAPGCRGYAKRLADSSSDVGWEVLSFGTEWTSSSSSSSA